MAESEIRQELLMACVAKAVPSLADHKGDGEWPGGKCPYAFVPGNKGNWKLFITDEEGDRVGAVGATRPEALYNLARKLDVIPAEEKANA